MRAWVGPRSPGVFESGAGVLSEIDHALAMLGTAHWMENSPALTADRSVAHAVTDSAVMTAMSGNGTKETRDLRRPTCACCTSSDLSRKSFDYRVWHFSEVPDCRAKVCLSE